MTAALWPLAWTVTTLAGIHVDEQFIIFGASGAVVYTFLAGLMLQLLVPQPAIKTVPVRVGATMSDLDFALAVTGGATTRGCGRHPLR